MVKKNKLIELLFELYLFLIKKFNLIVFVDLLINFNYD